jgi:hypothetical protein
MLQVGSAGSDVTRLQTALAQKGFRPQWGADGDFGAATKAAVMAFQRAQRLFVDGVVGAQTALKLFGSSDGKFFDGFTDGASSNRPRPGRGWQGSEGMADVAVRLAREMGVRVTSTKRNLADTIRVGSTPFSDHFTGNRGAYAVDFGVAGSRGTQLARRIADAYGIPRSKIGTYQHHSVTIGGQRYNLQLLWQVAGHHDHVHLGIRRA